MGRKAHQDTHESEDTGRWAPFEPNRAGRPPVQPPTGAGDGGVI